jgi:DNA (cytosine-5)-methyltransferase 1
MSGVTYSDSADKRRLVSRAPTFVDVFAGCGGLSLGLMQAGWHGLFAIEKNQDAFETLNYNLVQGSSPYRYEWPAWLPKKPISVETCLRRYRSNLENLVGELDMLVGGPPCQGFSSAGRRDPVDPRNKLVRSYLKLVRLLRPRIVLMENVRGITVSFEDTTTAGGRRNYADWIIKSLTDEYVVYSRMLDTSQFGVPQKRHRYFVVAVRKDQKTALRAGDPFTSIENNCHALLLSKGISAVPVSAKIALSDFELKSNGTMPSRDTAGFNDIAYQGPGTSYQRAMNSGCVGFPTNTRLPRHAPEISRRFRKIISLCKAEGRLNISLSAEVRASFGLRKCALRVF